MNVGASNFDCYVYEYFADNTAAFEALKVGDYLFHQEFFSSLWATAYDFPALEKGWVKREELPDGTPVGHPGLLVQPAPREVPGPARARGDRADVQLRVDERDAVLRALQAHRQLLRELADAGRGRCRRARSWRCSRSSATSCRRRSSPSPPMRRRSWGSEQLDRSALRRASQLLDEAGWTVGEGGLRRNAAGETLSARVHRRQRLVRARRQPLRRQPAADRDRRALQPGRRGADAAAPGGLRLRHRARPVRDVAQPLARAARSSSSSDAADAPGLGQPLRASPTRWSTR